MYEVDQEPEGGPSFAEKLPGQGSGVSEKHAPRRRWHTTTVPWAAPN